MDPLGICNAALGMVGAERIAALDEESTQAELCSDHFVAVRDAVLGERNWRFATRRHQLAAAGAGPVFGATRQFPLPGSVLKVIQATDGADELDDWQVEGRTILTDAAGPIFVRTIDKVEDVATWPPGFATAVTYRLAAVLAVPLTENRSREADLWGLYARHLHEAIREDGRQGVQEPANAAAVDFVNAWRR